MSGNQELTSMKSFLLPFGGNYPGRLFDAGADRYRFYLSSHMPCESTACLHLIISLEDACYLLLRILQVFAIG